MPTPLDDEKILYESELGKKSAYDTYYNPSKLLALPRKPKRDEIGIAAGKLPFFGFDLWNHYEVSWLDEKGKPIVAIAEIIYPCHSPNIIESKSMKLYFNSFNNTKFKNAQIVQTTVQNDFQARIGAPVSVKLMPLKEFDTNKLSRNFQGICLDDLDIECSNYTVDPTLLKTENIKVENEIFYSDLLKSNCLVTNQPDWGSVQITYTGQKINRAGLLKYIVSFRNHNEFHEQCIERIFIDITRTCRPEKLIVYGRYTRRGGLDINPFRSSEEINIFGENIRLCRQ